MVMGTSVAVKERLLIEEVLEQGYLLRLSGKNIRTGEDGYTWGCALKDSQIIGGKEKENYPPETLVAEQWICSDDQSCLSLVEFPGGEQKVLSRFLAEHGEQVLGRAHMEQFGPYLGSIMKLIETNDHPQKGSLSLQVHPAQNCDDLPPKPEMWLSLGQQSRLFLGWNKDMTELEVEKALSDKSIFQYLNQISLQNGERVIVPGGLVHAIRYGSFIAEWSVALTKQELQHEGLHHATVALSDETDGKAPRPGKADKNKALEVLSLSQGFECFNSALLNSPEQVLFQDEAGNLRRCLFHCYGLMVEEVIVTTEMEIDDVFAAGSCFVYQGQLSVQGTVFKQLMIQGEEFVWPITLRKARLVCAGQEPVRLFRWFRLS